MAEQPPWRAIQPPKLPRFTEEADGCDADEFYSGGGAQPRELQDGGRNSSGVADPGIGGRICPKGGAHSRSRGGRHSGKSFGSPRSNLRRPPLCSADFVPRPAAGNGGECSGIRAAPADADHQAERSASGTPSTPLCSATVLSTGCTTHPSVATFVATPGSMLTLPSIRHGLRLSAGCAKMLMWRCEQSRSWWLNPSTTRKWRSCGT